MALCGLGGEEAGVSRDEAVEILPSRKGRALADLIDPADDPGFAGLMESVYGDDLFDVLLVGCGAKPACFIEESIEATEGQSLDEALDATLFGRLLRRLRDGGWPFAAIPDFD